MRNKDFYSLDRWHKPFLENSYVKTVGLGLLLSCAGSPFTMAAISSGSTLPAFPGSTRILEIAKLPADAAV